MNVNCTLYVPTMCVCVEDENKAISPPQRYLIFILHPQAKAVQGVKGKSLRGITPKNAKVGNNCINYRLCQL